MNYIEMFPSASREKARFIAMAAAILEQVMDLIDVTSEINEAFSVNGAVGVQLDILGEFFSVPRQYGWSDLTYREYIDRKLSIWRWNGTNEMVSVVLTNQEGKKMIDNGDGTVSIVSGGVYPIPAGVGTVTL